MSTLRELDWQPILLSLQVAGVASLLAFFFGVLAALLTSREFWGKSLLEAVLLLPLVLPPVVTGYVLLVLFGKQAPLGMWLQKNLDFRVLFTPYAAVLASFVVAFPLMYQSAKVAFETIDTHLQDAARSLGSTPRQVFFTITVPLAWPGLVAGAILSFARALGEFGATIMVAGNIAGKTMTVPTAIYMATEDGDLHLAGIYSALLAVFNLLFILSLNIWRRKGNKGKR